MNKLLMSDYTPDLNYFIDNLTTEQLTKLKAKLDALT